jgi:hypothetical protein
VSDTILYVLISEAKDEQPSGFHDRIPLGVGVSLGFMDRPINFNNQACGMAIEISDETVDHLLSSEVQSGTLVRADILP